jgi:hypothetical protein
MMTVNCELRRMSEEAAVAFLELFSEKILKKVTKISAAKVSLRAEALSTLYDFLQYSCVSFIIFRLQKTSCDFTVPADKCNKSLVSTGP